MRRVGNGLLLALAVVVPVMIGCPAALPDPGTVEFACDENVDCTAGWHCVDRRCRPDDAGLSRDAAQPGDSNGGEIDHRDAASAHVDAGDASQPDIAAGDRALADRAPDDALRRDAGVGDGPSPDVASGDHTAADRPIVDAGAPDASAFDTQVADGNSGDATAADASVPDANRPDTGPVWWDRSYGHRRQISLRNRSASPLPAGYSVALPFDHAALVSSGKARSDGNDVRIVSLTTGIPVEIDRVAETAWNTATTAIWFRTQADVTASAGDDRYYVYYGNPTAPAAPSDRRHVYLFWDDFEDGSIDDWTVMSGSWSIATDQKVSGSYSLKATTGNRSWIRPTAALDYDDVEMEALMRVLGGGEDWSIVARVQPTTARNWYEANPEGYDWALGKAVNGAFSYLANATPAPQAGVWYRVALRLIDARGKIMVDGSQRVPASGYTNLGNDFASGSIACKTFDIGGAAWFDDVKLRRFRDPEPTTAAGPEE